MKRFIQCVKGVVKIINDYIDNAYVEYTKLKSQQLRELADASKNGDYVEAERIVEKI
ncbi:MAG: hypothetical protein WC238_00600 [Parcubacteria group bacterium]